MSEQHLGIKIKSSASEAKKEIDAVSSAVSSLTKNLTNAGYSISSIKKISNATGEYTKAVVTAKNGTETLRQTINSLGKTTGIQEVTKQAKTSKSIFATLFDVGKLYSIWNMTKGIRDALKSTVENAINFTETTNKFEVSMGNMKDTAYSFVNTITEKFGLATESIMNYQSTFNNIMKSLSGVSNETAYEVSESLTKMAVDYASLFNVSLSSSMTKFQAALTGQIKPIRSDSGYDISEKTLATKAQELGVTTSIKSLSEMDKRLLRIIVLTDQLKTTGAMGDFAKTIEQPSNQLKVLSNQFKELSTWIGNVFLGTIAKILPYVNGFVMALKEMAKALALFVGYENTGSVADPLQEADEYSNNTATNLGTAAKNAKELKKQLYGFDVLNVQQTPTSTSTGSSSSGTSTGITPEILSALQDYDNVMDNVKMKATEIRDKIMEWLGFTKKVNKLTGEVSFSLDNPNAKIYQIWEKIKDVWSWVEKIVAIFVAKTIFKELKNIFNFISNIFNLLKKIPGLKLFGTWFKTAGGLIVDTFKSWYKQTGNVFTALGETGSQLEYLLTPVQKVIAVVVAAIAAFELMYNAAKDLSSGTEMSAGKVALLGTALGAIGAAVTLFTGPIGLAVTAAVTLVGVIAGIVSGTQEAEKELAETKLFDGIGTPITEVVEQLETVTGGITEYAEKLGNLATEYEEWQGTLDNTKNSLENMMTQFSNANFDVTTENLATLSDTIEDLETSVKSTSQAFTDYITASTDELVEQGLISEETADKVVSAAIRKQKAEGKAVEAYKTAMADLEQQFKDGIITEEEYKQKTKELTDEYIASTEATDELDDNLSDLKKELQAKIDLKSWSTLQDSLEDINELYETQKQKIKDAYKKQKELLEQLLETNKKELEKEKEKLEQMDKTSKGYQKQKEKVQELEEEVDATNETIIAAAKEQAEKIANLNTTISNVTTDITDQIKDANGQITEEGQECLEAIGDLTNQMAADTMVAVDTATEAAKKMTKDINNQNPVLEIDVKADTKQATKDIDKVKKPFSISSSLKVGKTISVPSSTTELYQSLWSNFTKNGLSLKYYAKGGLPDVGQMFVAREAGPELVGTIGNKSAVVNNEQIVEAVSRGVAQAVAGVMGSNSGGAFNLYIDGQQITDVVTKRMNRMANITGGGYVYG